MIAVLAAAMLATVPALAGAQPLGSRALSLGMRGADVRTLQLDLTASGFVTGENGVYSRATRREVIAFQRSYGLTADGVVGPLTAAKLVIVAKIKAALGASNEPLSAETAKTGAASLGSTTSTKTTVSATTTTSGPTTSGPTTTSTTPTSSPGPSTTSTTPTTTPGSATTSTATTTTTTTTSLTSSTSGGAAMGPDPNSAPAEPATLGADGLAVAPADAPPAIAELIAAANRIAFLPYIYGGGHLLYHGDPVALEAGYDCSGSVSFALHGAGLLSEPLDSTEFETWGPSGPGQWITLWANGGHVYIEVAGLWFDTAAQSSANGEDRWSTTRISSASGFVEIHPAGM